MILPKLIASQQNDIRVDWKLVEKRKELIRIGRSQGRITVKTVQLAFLI